MGKFIAPRSLGGIKTLDHAAVYLLPHLSRFLLGSGLGVRCAGSSEGLWISDWELMLVMLIPIMSFRIEFILPLPSWTDRHLSFACGLLRVWWFWPLENAVKIMPLPSSRVWYNLLVSMSPNAQSARLRGPSRTDRNTSKVPGAYRRALGISRIAESTPSS